MFCWIQIELVEKLELESQEEIELAHGCDCVDPASCHEAALLCDKSMDCAEWPEGNRTERRGSGRDDVCLCVERIRIRIRIEAIWI